jgi:hypothetical protein
MDDRGSMHAIINHGNRAFVCVALKVHKETQSAQLSSPEFARHAGVSLNIPYDFVADRR